MWIKNRLGLVLQLQSCKRLSELTNITNNLPELYVSFSKDFKTLINAD